MLASLGSWVDNCYCYYGENSGCSTIKDYYGVSSTISYASIIGDYNSGWTMFGYYG